MSFIFPYQYGFYDNRKVQYPIVTVQLITVRGIRNYSFIMDTGADTLTLPKYMMSLLKIDKKQLKESASQGIGKELVKTWEGIIPIIFCNKKLNVYCSFTGNNKTPLLLGKESIFDSFNIIFNNDKQQTIFEERKSNSARFWKNSNLF